MKILLTWFVLLCCLTPCLAQLTRFETSNGTENAAYTEVMSWYNLLDKKFDMVKVVPMGETDAGIPLHLVLVSADQHFEPGQWHRENKIIILINNAIHAGEPDGVDASMMLVRDLARKNISMPKNVCLAFIPVYNIGGYLNRGRPSRVNQNGPLNYGFRGNSQNLDLNRDFIKCDSREALSFAKIFHYLKPDILIDNHVSDGADYQLSMTLLTTQYEKLDKSLGSWLKHSFEPAIYAAMKKEQWDLVPYVNFEQEQLSEGMHMFYDPPRFASGYAALFHTIGFVPETHMLKPYKDRVRATYSLMKTILNQASLMATDIKIQRNNALVNHLKCSAMPLSWKADSTHFDHISFKGYQEGYRASTVTGAPILYYDRSKPYEKSIRFYDSFVAQNTIKVPEFYVIPCGWHEVIKRLAANSVKMLPLKKDTVLEVEAYSITDYSSYKMPYEKHHKNYAVSVSKKIEKIRFLAGDILIPTQQPARRYLVETLEPTGEDGFFAWNFFDAVLQQKEGYSTYRWEPIAEQLLKTDAALKLLFDEKKKADSTFAANPKEQLEFIYKNSVYFEPEHMRYPVYRLMQ